MLASGFFGLLSHLFLIFSFIMHTFSYVKTVELYADYEPVIAHKIKPPFLGGQVYSVEVA